MSEENELKQEQLEKVTGGADPDESGRTLFIKYKETEEGKILFYEYGIVDSLQAKNIAQEWCTLNNKIYVGYLLSRATKNFDTKKLLDSITNNSN